MPFSGPAQSSPLWSAWPGLSGRRSGKATWTAVDPWALNFAPNTGDRFLQGLLLRRQKQADKMDLLAGLSLRARLSEVSSVIRPAVKIRTSCDHTTACFSSRHSEQVSHIGIISLTFVCLVPLRINQARVYLQAYRVGYKIQCPDRKGR